LRRHRAHITRCARISIVTQVEATRDSGSECDPDRGSGSMPPSVRHAVSGAYISVDVGRTPARAATNFAGLGSCRPNRDQPICTAANRAATVRGYRDRSPCRIHGDSIEHISSHGQRDGCAITPRSRADSQPSRSGSFTGFLYPVFGLQAITTHRIRHGPTPDFMKPAATNTSSSVLVLGEFRTTLQCYARTLCLDHRRACTSPFQGHCPTRGYPRCGGRTPLHVVYRTDEARPLDAQADYRPR